MSIKIPERISRTSVCAPKPSATPMTPADAMTGPRLNPNSPRIIPNAIIQIAALNVELNTVPIVRARSACRFAVPGPGLRSALAKRSMARSMAR